MNTICNKAKLFFHFLADKDRLNTTVGIFSILSVILIYSTLKEMQTQRDYAYRPEIVFETKQVDIEWGDKNALKNPLIQSNSEVNPSSISLNTYNIGVGAAKNLRFSLDYTSFVRLIKYLKDVDARNSYEYSIQDNTFDITINGKKNFSFSCNYEVDKLYLLPNAEESFVFNIPVQYTKLIEKIFEVHDKALAIPDIKLNLEYTDVQGKNYTKQILLMIKPAIISSDKCGSGCASYNVIAK